MKNINELKGMNTGNKARMIVDSIMGKTRKELILESLQKGNKILRLWKGNSSTGRLSHQLEGVSNLREKEVDQLRKDKVVIPEKGVGAFRPLILNK